MFLALVVLVLNVCLWLWWNDAPRRIAIFVKRSILGNKSAPRLPPGNFGFPLLGEVPFVLLSPGKDKLGGYRLQRTRKYGEIYCNSMPPLMNYGISVSSEEAVKWILSKENRGVEGEWDKATTQILGEHSVAVLTGKAHKRMRSALLPVFQPAFLREYAITINDIVANHFQKEWSPGAGNQTKRVVTRSSMKTLMLTIIATLVVGLDVEKDRHLIPELTDLLDTVLKGLFMPPFWFPGSPFSKGMEARKNMKQLLLGVIGERRKSSKSNRFDVLGLLLQPRKSETGENIILTDDEIFDILLVMLFAGTDTSTCAMTWIVMHLQENPDVLSHIRAEHDALRRSRKDPLATNITWEEMETLRYTNQLIFESLRMHPPVYGGFRRVTKDLVYKGYLIPKGYKVSFDLYTMTRGLQYHKSAESFNPDRFASDQAIGGLSKSGFMPFGSGARMCIGYRMALTEMNVIIHHLVLNYSWRAAPDAKGDVSYFPMPLPADGFPIEVEKNVAKKQE